MEGKIINLDPEKVPKALEEMTKSVIELVNVNQIYLGIGSKENPFKYRFILIVEDMAKQFKERTQSILNEIFQDAPGCYVRYFPLNYVIQETNNGNTFFLNNCTNDTLIYSHNQLGADWLFNKTDLVSVLDKAQQNYELEKKKLSSFMKGADLFINETDYGQAAFMLHQVLELCFAALERLLIGTRFKEHKISDHQNYLGEVIKDLSFLFPNGKEKQKELLNKLNNAYVKSRYTTNYTIELKQIKKIYQKAVFLIDKLDSYYMSEIASCKESIEMFNKGSLEKQNKTNQNKENEDFTEKEKTTLEQIEELGKDFLAKLTPSGHSDGSYLVNYFRVYDYLELFCMLRSTLNVCILALEDQQDLTLDIKNKESDVKMVLEFVKHLIPMEEANFLDDVRELIFPNEHEAVRKGWNKPN